MKQLLILAALNATACTYSENGCMVGHYCLVPFDGGSINLHDWKPTVNAIGPLEITAAKCDMLAHGTEPSGGSVFAVGSPAFVSSALAGATVQQGMAQMSYVQNTIRNCMVMNGFEKS